MLLALWSTVSGGGAGPPATTIVNLLHKFHSAQLDDPDVTLIRPSNWNDQHALTGSPGAILGFDGGGNAFAIAVTMVASLPAAPPDGSRAFVTDASVTTFASIVAGSGSNHVPVYYDAGTGNWRIG